MTDVTLYNPTTLNLVEANRKGNELYRTNRNMRDLADVMSNPKFRKVFNTHFNTWDDAKSTLMLMKTYEYIDTSFPKLSPMAKLHVLNEIVKNSKSRGTMVKMTQEWMEGGGRERGNCLPV